MNWTCPFCQHAQVITGSQKDVSTLQLSVGINKYVEVGLKYVAIGCANKKCGEVTLMAVFGSGTRKSRPGGGSYFEINDTIKTWNLLPAGYAKIQPEFIPLVIRNDYLEACAIRDLSPKASATLSRRCLQGMIRDFCGISRGRLADEIKELGRQLDEGRGPKGVDPETLEAIDAVRSIGNIGAHMERDIDIIVEVDEGEAQALIDLIELLFEDWYVARYNRQARLARLEGIAAEKQADLAQKRAAALSLEAPSEGPEQPNA